jgi:hypothetical protein
MNSKNNFITVFHEMNLKTRTHFAGKISLRILQVLTLFLFSLATPSCSKDEPDTESYRKGVFIINEGAFQNNNGSISWYDPNTNTLKNNLFEDINGRPLGDVVHSFFIHDHLGFAVVNNSQKVEVIDLKTFQSVGVVTDLSYPRYFVANETLGFISNGNFAGEVVVINLSTLQIVDEIAVGSGPEQMAIVGNNLYVANSGGWGIDNTISVIDIPSLELIKTIVVGDIPIALQTDQMKSLWVICRGKVVYDWDTWEIIEETDSELFKINTTTNTVSFSTVIGSTGDFTWPGFLVSSGNKTILYFNESGGIYAIDTSSETISSSPIIAESFSGFGVHPVSGEFYGLSIPDYTSSGSLTMMSPSKEILYEKKVGIAPTSVVFSP